MSKVSIVIPIYNAEKYLAETLESVLIQTFCDWECLLVNDGSTDNSLNIIKDYCSRDKRFKLLTKQNSGCADIPIAFGMDHISSSSCLYIGNDDVLEQEYLEKLINRQQETGADIVSPTIIYCEHELDGEIWRLPCQPISVDSILTGSEACAYTIGKWCLTTNGMLYRANLNKGIIRGHYMNSDEFSSRQILFKASVVAFSEARYIYRQHGDSISRKMSPRLWERLIVNKQLEDFIFEHYPDNEDIKKSVVGAVFFKQIALTAAAWQDANKIEKESRRAIRNSVKQAYTNMDKERVRTYLPKHGNLFLHGVNVFIIMSILYTFMRRMQGKKDEL